LNPQKNVTEKPKDYQARNQTRKLYSRQTNFKKSGNQFKILCTPLLVYQPQVEYKAIKLAGEL
jgi:hypothetical protein